MKITGKGIRNNLLAVSILLLSASFLYFSIVIKQIGEQIPDALSTIENATEKVNAALAEVKKIRAMVPSIAQELAETRHQIPAIIDEATLIRQQVPIVLEEIGQIRQQIPAILDESAALRALAPSVLEEVKKTREAAPHLLIKIENIVAETERIGKSTTEGAVTGVVTGVLKTPFRVLSSFAKAVFGIEESISKDLTESDMSLLHQAAYRLLDSDKLGDSLSWSNTESKNGGTISIQKQDVKNNRRCKELSFAINLENKRSISETAKFCLDDENKWQPIKN